MKKSTQTLTPSQSSVLKLGYDKGTFTAQDLPLKGGACKKVIDSLLNKEFIKPVNRNGRWFDYALTPAGRQAIGVESPDTQDKPSKPNKPKARPGSKLDQVITMLMRSEGATIAQMMEQTGWQQHTVRGTLAGALKKRLGLTVESEKTNGEDRVYRITGGMEAADA
ncbi:DUF3489 domain-containing protein [Sansalvadorimonas verongulae]|uniref:DUF3489 domain-containing protein n=1 Tax=Sansalvadorimonas verongulae TaxID=2172824 RepID=UPI0012BB5FD2|nr:DUF3489 domain-containing protein [Sansalvadorimonas verongulae]MTI15134.1 DUF3489 domain-containing protein [Sansalvadorimonas verongulae]